MYLCLIITYYTATNQTLFNFIIIYLYITFAGTLNKYKLSIAISDYWNYIKYA